jgi:DNA-binding XRE family transcriptional regulator
MMAISVEQIRAARAWAGMSRGQLAAKSGVSEATVKNLEKGKVSVRSMECVRMALEALGFKFHGKNSVTRSNEESRTYEGPGSCHAFYDELLATVKQHGGEIGAIFKTQEHFLRSLGITDFSDLERLERITRFAPIKCMLFEQREVPLAIPSCEFRATIHSPINPIGTFIFGDTTVMAATNCETFAFVVMRSVTITQDAWKSFRPSWTTGFPLPVKPAVHH